MKVELFYFYGCPGYEGARRALEEALDLENARAEIEPIGVGSEEEAQG
jgi:hypothetical protein